MFCGAKKVIYGQNLTFFDFWPPPNLAKSPLRSDSIKILTKGLLHYSRKRVRMPKFRNFYRTSPEISTFFSLFSYSVSWQGRRGPFPWLEDCECKRARPPRGQAWPKSGVGSVSQVFVANNCLRISFAVADWSLVMMSHLTFWQKVIKMTESVFYLNVISAMFSKPSRSGSDKILREQNCNVLL